MSVLLLGGVGIGLVLRLLLERPLLGEAVYWVGVLGFLAVWFGSPVTLFDERDKALEQRASVLTLGVFAVVFPVSASAARVLSYTDTIEVPAEIWTVLWGYVALYGVFAGIYGWLRYRQ
jgi:hypothetical protein